MGAKRKQPAQRRFSHAVHHHSDRPAGAGDAGGHRDPPIPSGQTTTYGALARAISAETGRPMASQAVGGAVGRNPISIIIPCHRVVGTNGSLTGYAGGLDKKRWLLAHEGVDLTRFSTPAPGQR